MKIKILNTIFLFILASIVFGQNYTEILGKPTNSSITINILLDQKADVYWEYGTTSGSYPFTSATFTSKIDTPLVAEFTNLLSNTKYYYRTRYRVNGSSSAFSTGQEHTFQTQRASGSTFSFAIEADPHLDTNTIPASYTLTLQNILAKKPDFMIDLGDIFMSEKLPLINQAEITNRHLLYRPFFNEVCHSVPLYLVLGNHEGELGWRITGQANSLPVMATNTRKFYYPNPEPNSFYSGDTIEENMVGLRQDYYAWEWGDALFIVLDPYWHTVTKPDWGWTLGETQYNWFKSTITSSQAKFKFVFCHNLVGGKGNDARGGAEYVDFFEMGGQNADSTFGFDTYRPNWGKSIHQLMVENNATIFFHGHDHLYAKQEKDGLVYQEVPQPSAKSIGNVTGAQWGYVDGVLMSNRGYILVTVNNDSTRVEYIKTYLPSEENATRHNGDIAHSYTISNLTTDVNDEKTNKPSFQIEQNYPNPFYSETTIRYKLFSSNNVQLSIYDIYGSEVYSPIDKFQEPGNYSTTINSEELNLKSGFYYCKIHVGNNSSNMKMIFIK
ncbi:MAG: metallophosphoesterase [Bacteroidota bacterium]